MSKIILVVPESINDTGEIGPEFVVAAGVAPMWYTLPYGFFRFRAANNDWQIMTIKNSEPVFCKELPILQFVQVLPEAPSCILLVSREDYPMVNQFLIQAGHEVILHEYTGSLSTHGLALRLARKTHRQYRCDTRFRKRVSNVCCLSSLLRRALFL